MAYIIQMNGITINNKYNSMYGNTYNKDDSIDKP